MTDLRLAALYLTDGNRDDLTYASIASLAMFHRRPIDVHLFQSGFSAAVPATVCALVERQGHALIVRSVEPAATGMRAHGHLTATACDKVDAVEAITREYDVIAYFDCDTLAVGDLDLFGLMPRRHAVAAVVDLSPATVLGSVEFRRNCARNGVSPLHFNSGVMVIDTAKWREFDIAGRYAPCLQAHDAFCPYYEIAACRGMDQCALNIVLNGSWQPLPLVYNAQKSVFQTRLWSEARIRHHCGPEKFLPVRAHRADRTELTALSRVARSCPDLPIRASGAFAGLAFGANALRRLPDRRAMARRMEVAFASDPSLAPSLPRDAAPDLRSPAASRPPVQPGAGARAPDPASWAR